MTKRPQPKPGILNIAPYVPGKSGTRPGQQAIKLSSNESPLGASPLASAAYAEAVSRLAEYPEGSSAKLRETLAEAHGLEAERIVIGAGSDEILHLLAETYLGDGDEAVQSEYGFLMYPIATMGAGAAPVVARDRNYTVDVDAMLAAVTDRTRIVWLANPNNPTGTWLDDAEVRRLHAGLRPDIVFVIDNAYAEYVTAPGFTTGAELVREADNVVMVRTFSKMGLAALRVGWLYGPDHIVDAINRIRGPFNVSVPAQEAAAAATRDSEFTASLAAHNARWRDYLTAELRSNHVTVPDSQGNFILAIFDEAAGPSAADVFAALADAGLITREMGGYGLANAVRISIGSEDAMRRTVAVIKRLQGEGN
ncbi:MAG: histidinol-phosphate transaminase [Alphaproteobacteria bacterium]|nr:histidinol-phosphate transaminase [Alphaproteobacteria bacterium]